MAGFLSDVFEAAGFDMLRLARGGTALTIAPAGQGGSFSLSIAEGDAFFKDYTRIEGVELDELTASVCVRSSALGLAVPIPGWLVNAASGFFAGTWTVQRVEPATATAMAVLRVSRRTLKGTPTA